VSRSIEIAKNERRAIFIGKPVHLLQDHPPKVRISQRIAFHVGDEIEIGGRHFAADHWALCSASRDIAGHSIQPSSDRSAASDAGCPQGKREEHGLARVLGRLVVSECRLTNSEHHAGVPPDEQFECSLVFGCSEAGK
jgi:hypothetical protein